MHCLLKWIETDSSKQQCPLDRRPWGKLTRQPHQLTSDTADRKPDRLPTTVDGAPVASVAPGPIAQEAEEEDSPMYEDEMEDELDDDEEGEEEEADHDMSTAARLVR